jgi:hypothetical protein
MGPILIFGKELQGVSSQTAVRISAHGFVRQKLVPLMRQMAESPAQPKSANSLRQKPNVF